jgi:hypothetical protein
MEVHAVFRLKSKAREKTSGTSETPSNGTTKDDQDVSDDLSPALHDSRLR